MKTGVLTTMRGWRPARRASACTHARQRGAAALIVVMVLFFVMSLVAAYASRNIIFEQRTASNQYGSMVSLEAANAGLDWALGLLNGSRIDPNCTPTSSPAHDSFRQRYLQVDPDSGEVTVPADVSAGPRWPSCWYNRATHDWVCSCPTSGAATPASVPSDPFTPAFRVRFVRLLDAITVSSPSEPRPSVVYVEVNGCTSWNDSACMDFAPKVKDRCQGSVCAQLALSSGLKSPPVAAITARAAMNFGGAAVTAANTAPGSSGQTVIAGQAINQTGMTLLGPPGMPAARTVVASDAGLADPLFTPERMFASIFGVWPATYVEQPGAVKVSCAGGCDSAMVRNAIEANPGRVLILQGNVALNGGASIGTATDPAVLVATGNFGFSTPTDVYGLVYSRSTTWTTSGTGNITGAMVAEGDIAGNGAFTVNYARDVLNRLRVASGSFVMVPGSWRDYP